MILIIRIEWVNADTGEILSASQAFDRDYFDGTREYTKETFYKVLYAMLNYVRERNGVIYRMSFDTVCESFFACDCFSNRENEFTLENIYRYAREK